MKFAGTPLQVQNPGGQWKDFEVDGPINLTALLNLFQEISGLKLEKLKEKGPKGLPLFRVGGGGPISQDFFGTSALQPSRPNTAQNALQVQQTESARSRPTTTNAPVNQSVQSSGVQAQQQQRVLRETAGDQVAQETEVFNVQAFKIRKVASGEAKGQLLEAASGIYGESPEAIYMDPVGPLQLVRYADNLNGTGYRKQVKEILGSSFAQYFPFDALQQSPPKDTTAQKKHTMESEEPQPKKRRKTSRTNSTEEVQVQQAAAKTPAPSSPLNPGSTPARRTAGLRQRMAVSGKYAANHASASVYQPAQQSSSSPAAQASDGNVSRSAPQETSMRPLPTQAQARVNIGAQPIDPVSAAQAQLDQWFAENPGFARRHQNTNPGYGTHSNSPRAAGLGVAIGPTSLANPDMSSPYHGGLSQMQTYDGSVTDAFAGYFGQDEQRTNSGASAQFGPVGQGRGFDEIDFADQGYEHDPYLGHFGPNLF